MKKLLIATMAAASLAFCAKADFAENGTSFEGLTEGAAFNPTDTYWTIPTDTDDVFKITNVTYSADATKQHWDWTDGEKALFIDTANPILRNANPVPNDDTTIINPPQDVTTPIFFDSVVQFTATDVAGERTANDKLRIWLYMSPDDVSETNPGLFNETTTKKTLVITAGVLETNDGVQSIVKKDYDTGIEIESESWHRLTIKSFLNDAKTKLMFNVWIDGAKDPITADGVTDFLSLVTPNVNSDNYLQGVAFDGKGAVDDIVFTTTDPFAVPSYKVTVKIDDADEESSGAYKQYSVDGGVTYVGLAEDKVYGAGDILEIPQTATKVIFKIAIPNEDKKLEGVDASAGEYEDGGFYWIKEVNIADIISNGEGEVVLKVVDNTSTPEVTTYKVTVNSADATVEGVAEKYAADTVVTFAVKANSGYEVVSVMMNTTALSVNDEGNYSFTMPAEAVTITVTTKAVVTYPTVEPEGDDVVITEPLSGNANTAIQSAFAGVSASDMPTKLTVIVNGVEYVNNEAIKMINDAVEMFTLTEGAKFFDAQGKLDISFKATGANPDAVAYEAEVGGSTATVNAAYEVVPKYIDIATNTELTAKPEGTVTFRLVIQKKK
jgi:hypothetical protein